MEQTFLQAVASSKPVARGRTRALVQKARASALAAVAAYNNPLASFKSGTYVVLMHVAWTSLLLAVLRRRGVTTPYYRDEGTGGFETVDGRPKVWELRECLKQCWGSKDDAVSQNLRFFIGLRNLIEHADAPAVDLDIFGECQALLFNFEAVLAEEFGDRYALNAALAVSLQFSRTMDDAARRSVQTQFKLAPRDLRRYIDGFRGALSTDILNDMKYSYKVFLIPMLGNHRTKEALAVEFVHFDPNDPDQDRAVALIKPKTVAIANHGLLAANEVVRRVSALVAPKRINTNTHAAACRYWRVRPDKGAADQSQCDTRYCVYDERHRDYAYTPEWVTFLGEQLRDDSVFDKATSRSSAAKGTSDAVPSFLRTRRE